MENLLKQSIMYLVIKELEEEYKIQIKKEQDSVIDPFVMCLKCHQRGHINCNEMMEDNIYKIN
ncbi:hypothetical protein pb186bvf_010344 [Paramecium bursaria]